MNLTNRVIYFFVGLTIGLIAVVYIAKKKNIQFAYGFDARTLKSIRVKEHRYYSEEAQKAILENNLDSIQLEYLLTKSDVDFSESDTDTKKPCQTYRLNGELKEAHVSLLIKRCDSSATFEEVIFKKK